MGYIHSSSTARLTPLCRRRFRPTGRQPLRVSWKDAGSKKMRMLLYVFAFAVIGLAVGLIFRKVRPYQAPPSLWISTLIGVI